eukprot:TRINITY_DN10181_c0_g1_i1.p1 TRINITY_DN10181_c0_g1~~TRINITY_DN10181_c0_g1_i1.p1  ORF type:complete len:474 (+),score=33.20 TRINITY_DN10181_c0_g1_i1:1133-2554(+)
MILPKHAAWIRVGRASDGDRNLFRSVAICIIFCLIQQSESTLFIKTNTSETVTITTYAYPRIPEVGPYEFEGPAVWIPIKNGAPDLTNMTINGSIVFLEQGASFIQVPFWTQSSEWINSGVRAVIVFDGPPSSVGGLGNALPAGLKINYHMACSDTASRDIIKNLNSTIVSAILRKDHLISPWMEIQRSGYFWFICVSLVFVSAAIVILGIGRLFQFRTAIGKWEMNVINAVIVLETVGAILRFVYWVVDPLGFRGIWPDQARDIWHTISMPLSVAATGLLTLYWHETVSASSVKFSFSIERLRIPAYILVVVVFLVEIVFDTLVLTAVSNLPTIGASIYLVVALGLSIFFIVTSLRVLVQIWRIFRAPMGNETTTLTRRLKAIIPVAIKLLITAVSWLGIISAGIVATSDGFNLYIPSYICGVWWGIHVFLSIKAFSIVLALHAPGSSRSGKSNGHSGKPDSLNSASDGQTA